MPRQETRERSFEVIPFIPLGTGGLDLFTDPALLPRDCLARAENVRKATLAINRRRGALKLRQATDSTGSKTFGTDGKYATLPTSTEVVIPKGGFAVRWDGTAVRPSGGNTAYIIGSRPPAVAWHVFSLTLSDAGVLTTTWRDSGGNTRTVAASAVADGASVHYLCIYDAPAGTFTVYIDGASSGTPLTGLASTLQPDTTASVVWAFGVEKQTGAGVTANTHFDGKFDTATLFSLRGTRPSSGTTTLASVLRKHTFRAWPCPQMDNVLFHYDMDNSSTGTAYDASEHKNNATLVGTPSNTAAVSYSTIPGNVVHVLQSQTGARHNVVAAGGALSYEEIRGAN